MRIEKNIKQGFTLIELLVVIAIIALLMSIMMPALSKAKEHAKVIVCMNHLKTLTLANEAYSMNWNGRCVPLIDDTNASSGARYWNTNDEFRTLVGVNDKDTGSLYEMPKEYWCPSHKNIKDDSYWENAVWANRMSYAYNMTDWGSDSVNPYTWAIGSRCLAMKGTTVQQPQNKIMFIDAADLWTQMSGAAYQTNWDLYGDDIETYRSVASASNSPTMYRHSESASVGYYDGHVKKNKKESLFYYVDGTDSPDEGRNYGMWFANKSNIQR